jgi:hypothetical protein
VLIIEIWNGNAWRHAGRIRPGTRHTLIDHKRGEPLHLVVETDSTTVMTDSNSPLLTLRFGDAPWERVLTADWLPAAMLCRLHHRPPAKVGSADGVPADLHTRPRVPRR